MKKRKRSIVSCMNFLTLKVVLNLWFGKNGFCRSKYMGRFVKKIKRNQLYMKHFEKFGDVSLLNLEYKKKNQI